MYFVKSLQSITKFIEIIIWDFLGIIFYMVKVVVLGTCSSPMVDKFYIMSVSSRLSFVLPNLRHLTGVMDAQDVVDVEGTQEGED